MTQTRNSRLSVVPHGALSLAYDHSRRYEISDEALAALEQDVLLRRTSSIQEWFERRRKLLAGLDPEHANTPAFIGYLAQWADCRGNAAPVLRELLAKIPTARRRQLTLADNILLRLAEGILALAAGDDETALRHLEFILALAEEGVAQPSALAWAHFWKARCLYRRGKHDLALTHVARGREIARELGYPQTAAVMQALEGWLYLQREKFSRAMEAFREAEAVLRETDDALWLGNIHAGYGCIAIREGRYELGAEHLARAVESYGGFAGDHRNLARALVNLAHAERMIASRIARQIDARVEKRRRSAGREAVEIAGGDGEARRRIEQLRKQALAHLDWAERIYRPLGKRRGLAMAQVERGFVLAECGELERAAEEARAAFETGSADKDSLVLAGARLLESAIENMAYEEGLDENPTQHAHRAHDFAKDAVTYARECGDSRMLARAHVCYGLILCSDALDSPDAARECCRSAGELLGAGNRDQLWADYQALSVKALRSESIDAKLRKWSQGAVEGKSFQQITEEFADIVIPSVWAREGKNVSRVVAKLAISPKKVRRILNRAGLKGAPE